MGFENIPLEGEGQEIPAIDDTGFAPLEIRRPEIRFTVGDKYYYRASGSDDTIREGIFDGFKTDDTGREAAQIVNTETGIRLLMERKAFEAINIEMAHMNPVDPLEDKGNVIGRGDLSPEGLKELEDKIN